MYRDLLSLLSFYLSIELLYLFKTIFGFVCIIYLGIMEIVVCLRRFLYTRVASYGIKCKYSESNLH